MSLITRLSACAGLFLLTCASAFALQEKEKEKPRKPERPTPTRVAGVVLDEKEKPVKDIEVGVAWSGTEKELSFEGALHTDRTGKFSGEMTLLPRAPAAFFAMDKTRKKGGIAVAEAGGFGDLSITLAPMITVSGTFELSSLKSEPETIDVIVQTSPDRLDLVRYEVPAKRKFAFRLPPGKYEVSLSCEAGEREPRIVNVVKGKTQIDLGKLAVRPAAKKRVVDEPAEQGETNGKPEAKKPAARKLPALTVTDARGVKKAVQLADYKGKWVMLDFWGAWCNPCVTRSIPALMDFQEKHKADADKFAILTMHCGGGRMPETFAALDERLPALEGVTWKGRKFPFPILIDSTQKTTAEWEIKAFPTTVLIDPDGNLVMKESIGVEERLAQELKKSAKPAAEAPPPAPKKKPAKKPEG